MQYSVLTPAKTSSVAGKQNTDKCTLFYEHFITNYLQYIHLIHSDITTNKPWGNIWILCFLCLNTLRPRRNEQHFADNIFKRIFFNENVWISIKISLKFVPKGPINNIPALIQIMAWCCSGDKPLSEPMMVSLPTHICVTQPQWVNPFVPLKKIPRQICKS